MIPATAKPINAAGVQNNGRSRTDFRFDWPSWNEAGQGDWSRIVVALLAIKPLFELKLSIIKAERRLLGDCIRLEAVPENSE